jgi:hypothetical protein
VSIAAAEYQSTPSDSPPRVPIRSSRRPISGCPTVYERRKAMITRAKLSFVQWNSSLRWGPRTLKVWRSR